MSIKPAGTTVVFAFLAALLPGVSTARADSLSITLQSSQVTASPGTTVPFRGTISAPSTNSAPVYLNGDTLNVASPLVGDDTPFVDNFLLSNYAINPGSSFFDVFFDITLPLTMPPGAYQGSFEITGGPTLDSQELLTNLPFSVSVPEPGSFLLFGAGLLGILAVLCVWRKRSAVHVIAVIAFAGLPIIGSSHANAQNTGTVDFSTNLQPIDGFGFANPFGRSGYVQNSPAISQAVVDQFFNPITGAGASMLRIGIDTDSNIEPNSPGDPSATPIYVWDGIDGGQVWFAQQGQKYGLKRFYADSWSAPAFMKTNNNVNSGGAICGTPNTSCATGDWRQAYANYLIQYLNFYRQAGIPITDLSFVNEPDQNVSYQSMTLSTAQVVDFLKVLGPAVQASGLAVNLNCCDHSNWNGAKTYTTAVVNDPGAYQYVNTFTGHQYGVNATSPLPTTKNTWMSEWASSGSNAFNATWDTPSNATNDGMYLANNISNALTLGNVSAYVYWYGDSTGATGGFFSLSATTGATSYVLTKRLYALAAFARFVRPGAYRVPATTNNTSVAITAFRNANGNKVINLINNATSTVILNLSLDSESASALASSYLTDENDAIAPVNAAVVTGQTVMVSLSPRSLTTLTLAPAIVNGTVQLSNTATLQKLGDGTFQATLTIANKGTGTAQNVQLNSASLGAAIGSTLPAAPLPLSVGTIAPGSYATFVVNFPTTAGDSGAVVIEKYSGTYTGGTFSSSIRATLP